MSTTGTNNATLQGGMPTQKRPLTDWLFAVLVIGLGGWGFKSYGSAMDVYENAILAAAIGNLGTYDQPEVHALLIKFLGSESYHEELAGAAVFLASPLASFINGVTLPVDGGTLAV